MHVGYFINYEIIKNYITFGKIVHNVELIMGQNRTRAAVLYAQLTGLYECSHSRLFCPK